MAKAIQCASYAPQSRSWLTGLRALLAGFGAGPRPAPRLNPEEWSGHMLRDIGLPDHLAQDLPSRQQTIWMR
jgi:hypothetical protein